MTGQQLKNSILQMAVQGKLVPQGAKEKWKTKKKLWSSWKLHV